jgi:hypothetical protein
MGRCGAADLQRLIDFGGATQFIDFQHSPQRVIEDNRIGKPVLRQARQGPPNERIDAQRQVGFEDAHRRQLVLQAEKPRDRLQAGERVIK